MTQLLNKAIKQKEASSNLLLITLVLLASWIAVAGSNGGFIVGDWAPVNLILTALTLIGSVVGVLRGAGSRWGNIALGLFAAYAVWTLASLLWSMNRGAAWAGAGQTLLYLLAFWLSLGLVSLGSSRRWVLAASALGPAIIAALTLSLLAFHIDNLFFRNRLLGFINYPNGEAAFFLVPFWVSVYLAGSRRVNPLLRGLILAGTVLSVSAAVLTQSRGAMIAMAASLPVFFLISGQRLRGLFALAPISLAVWLTFPDLNGVYHIAFQRGQSAMAATAQALPEVLLAAVGAGLYGVAWGLMERRWELSTSATRLVGGAMLAGGAVVLILGAVAVTEHGGNPITYGEQRWEALKNDTAGGQEQNRFLAASDSGRYAMWQVAWKDFNSHPLVGVGTHNYEATYYQLRERPVGFVKQPHSLPLEVLAERGIVGGVLFSGFLAACLGAGLWKRFTNLTSEGKAQIGAMSAAVAYWFVHSSVEWFWQLPAVTLPAIVYLAMLVGPWGRIEVAPLRWPLRAVGAGAALVALAIVAPLYAADYYLAQKEATTDSQKALAAVERAQRFNPVDPWLRVHEAEAAAKVGDRQRVERAFDEAVRLNPEHYVPHLLHGQFYEAVGEPERALQSYRQAQALNPLDDELDQKVDEITGRVRAE